MGDMFLALCAMTFMACYYYGLRALAVAAVSVVSSYITDIICVKIRGKRYDIRDISAVVSGLTLALMLPASIPYQYAVLTNVFAIIVAKQVFGGRENSFFSVPAVGFLFASICWSDIILMYPKPGTALELTNTVRDQLSMSLSATLNIASNPSVTNIDLLLGRFCGPMGATQAIVLIACAVALVIRHSMSLLTFFSGLGTVLAFAFFMPKFGSTPLESVMYETVSGMVLFGLVFLASDCRCLPKRRSARFLYGIAIGLMTVMFRRIGVVENAIVCAVIIAAPIGISLDKSALSFSRMYKKSLAVIRRRIRKARQSKINAGGTGGEQV